MYLNVAIEKATSSPKSLGLSYMMLYLRSLTRLEGEGYALLTDIWKTSLMYT